ncbi:MAG: hypothetical protein U5K70_00005 [Halodesulfurarchaeum sp.]|nr:hypothetical protein [Halodesulfurarchaeum sp.]
MVKKNEIIEIEINDVDFPNKGIGRYEDKKVIVKSTIRGKR